MGMISEFKDFLEEYKVMGLAIAFIMGAAVTTLVKSLVDNLIMPFIAVLIPDGAWKTATLALGPVMIVWGAFVAELINFIIIALVIFLMAKFILSEEKVTKK